MAGRIGGAALAATLVTVLAGQASAEMFPIYRSDDYCLDTVGRPPKVMLDSPEMVACFNRESTAYVELNDIWAKVPEDIQGACYAEGRTKVETGAGSYARHLACTQREIADRSRPGTGVPVTDCDRLASRNGSDPLSLAPGFAMADIDHAKAIPACEQALAEQPKEGRFAYMLGRSLDAAGQYEKARQSYLQAVDLGEKRAFLNLGILSEEGRGVEADFAAAVAWYKKGRMRAKAVARTILPASISEATASNRASSRPWLFIAKPSSMATAKPPII